MEVFFFFLYEKILGSRGRVEPRLPWSKKKLHEKKVRTEYNIFLCVQTLAKYNFLLRDDNKKLFALVFALPNAPLKSRQSNKSNEPTNSIMGHHF